MKTPLFLKLNAIALVALLGVISLMSFGQKEKGNEKVAEDTTYFYNSEEMDEFDFRETGHWTTNELIGSVGCQTSGARPCKVIVPEGYSLSDVLGSKNNAQVLDISVNRKLAP